MELSLGASPATATARTIRFSPGLRSKSATSSSVQVELRGAIAPGWALVQPLSIWIQQDEDGDYIASDEAFYVYGQGSSLVAAQDDYIWALIEYYEIVSAYEDAPSRQLLAQLRRYLRPTQ